MEHREKEKAIFDLFWKRKVGTKNRIFVLSVQLPQGGLEVQQVQHQQLNLVFPICLSFLKKTTPTLVAFIGITIVHGPVHQSTACRSIKLSYDHNLRQGLNRLCLRSLMWMMKQSGAHLIKLKYYYFFNFLFHNSHDKFDRQKIIVSNQINQTESCRKCRCFAWVRKRVSCHQGLISRPRAWQSIQCSQLSVIPLSYPGTPHI